MISSRQIAQFRWSLREDCWGGHRLGSTLAMPSHRQAVEGFLTVPACAPSSPRGREAAGPSDQAPVRYPAYYPHTSILPTSSMRLRVLASN